MHVFGPWARDIKVLEYFWIAGCDKIGLCKFDVFMCVYNIGKVAVNLQMCMDSHFGMCAYV
jgi:hypothetical protein